MIPDITTLFCLFLACFLLGMFAGLSFAIYAVEQTLPKNKRPSTADNSAEAFKPDTN